MLPAIYPKICFSIPASPNDNFYSQIAMFRLALDSLGGIYKGASIIVVLSDEDVSYISNRWASYFGDTTRFIWAAPQIRQRGDYIYAQNIARWEYDYDDYDIVIFCDADTLLVDTVDDLLAKMQQTQAVMGTIAHYPFFRIVDDGSYQIWNKLANRYIGKSLDFEFRYTLVSDDTSFELAKSPFYLNYGFVVLSPKIIRTIANTYLSIRSKLASDAGLEFPIFASQIALTLSLAAHDIPNRAIGLRYNFPNDSMADRLHQKELEDVRLIHYLRTDIFDRQLIFIDESNFNDFLSLELNGSNKVFQEHVRKLTKGRYPFIEKQPIVCESISRRNMEFGNKKIIVVLGMHRSGTSVITRGLQVLGVELGNNLMPPIPGNNDTGFWEDVDINSLNIEMLNFLKTDWYYLTPIQNSDVNILVNRGYLQRAMELLNKKIANCEVFGFKDPRTTKLLPFWLEVFRQGQFDISYVISLRHPLSVCHSLSKRDGFEIERGAFLWLEHVLSSLIGTAGENRVLVEYDRFMQTPEAELERIAAKFQFQINPVELEKFKEEFLKEELRHTFFKVDDLNRDDMPQLIREVFTNLLSDGDLASSKISKKLNQWNVEFVSQKNAFKLVDYVTSKVVSLQKIVADNEKTITDNEITIADRERELSEIYRSKAWLAATLLQRMRMIIAPPGSWRAKLASKIFSLMFFTIRTLFPKLVNK